MPTLLPQPWPSGPVVVSTPAVWRYSGWPGVLLPIWRNSLRSSSDSEGPLPAELCAPMSATPVRWINAYSSMEAWPADSTKRSRFGQVGSAGS